MFDDRTDAGLRLARLLSSKSYSDLIVLALPRGGVVVAKPISDKLVTPLRLLLVKKLSAPLQPELAIGAITEKGQRYINTKVVNDLGVDSEYVTKESKRVIKLLTEKRRMYGGADTSPTGKTVVLVDDGLATGATVKAAIVSLREQKAKKIILAIPVLPREQVEEIEKGVDELVYLLAPDNFLAVGQFFRNFPQVSDEKVLELLQ
ncbi:phosphoribosyltransferase [Patescibacteria group bacterium]